MHPIEIKYCDDTRSDAQLRNAREDNTHNLHSYLEFKDVSMSKCTSYIGG